MVEGDETTGMAGWMLGAMAKSIADHPSLLLDALRFVLTALYQVHSTSESVALQAEAASTVVEALRLVCLRDNARLDAAIEELVGAFERCVLHLPVCVPLTHSLHGLLQRSNRGITHAGFSFAFA